MGISILSTAFLNASGKLIPKSKQRLSQKSIATIAVMVKAVFSLPHIPAATTIPLFAARSLSPDTINSLAVMIMNGMALIFTSLNSTKTARAAITRTLSAKGSRNLPKLVTRFLDLAIFPSRASVIEAIPKMASATRK